MHSLSSIANASKTSGIKLEIQQFGIPWGRGEESVNTVVVTNISNSVNPVVSGIRLVDKYFV